MLHKFFQRRQHSKGDVPKATEKKYIVLFCENVDDGVGDYAHWLSHAKALKPLIDKGYELIGVMSLNQDVKNEIKQKRIRYVESEIEKLEQDNSKENKLFEKIFIRNTEQNADNFLQLNPELNAYIKDNAAIISVSYGHGFPQKLCGKDNVLIHASYGGDGDMGLPYISDSHSEAKEGIKFYPEHQEINPSSRLHEVGKTDKHFIQTLLQKEDYSKAECENYLNSTSLSTAYFQTPIALAAYILFQLERAKQSQDNDKPIDIIAPQIAVDEKLINEIIAPWLKENDLSSTDVAFLNKDELKKPYVSNTESSRPRVRVLSPFVTKKEDYDALFHISNAGVGASGDNTISEALSAKSLPFLQMKYNPNLTRFLKKQLPGNIDMSKQKLELSEKQLQNFEKLKQYFGEQSKLFYSEAHELGKEGVFEYDFFGEPETYEARKSSIAVDGSEEKKYYVTDRIEQLNQLAKKAAELSLDSGVQQAWKSYQQYLFKTHNILDKLIPIVQEAAQRKQPDSRPLKPGR